MAQTKKKRRRKHRGTQGGSIDSGGRRSKPRSRDEARAQARKKQTSKKDDKGKQARPNRLDQPPTWRSATIRGMVAAVLFVVLVVVIFEQSVSEALMFGAFMLLFYIPAGYYMDSFIWRRRERARIRAANDARAKKQRGEEG